MQKPKLKIKKVFMPSGITYQPYEGTYADTRVSALNLLQVSLRAINEAKDVDKVKANIGRLIEETEKEFEIDIISFN